MSILQERKRDAGQMNVEAEKVSSEKPPKKKVKVEQDVDRPTLTEIKTIVSLVIHSWFVQ